MNEALLVMGMALVTFLIRYPMLAIIGRVELPPVLIRALRFVPVAVLTGITIPAMLLPQGSFDLNLSNAYLYAGIIAGVIAWRTKNLLLTIVLGMAIFMLWRTLGG